MNDVIADEVTADDVIDKMDHYAEIDCDLAKQPLRPLDDSGWTTWDIAACAGRVDYLRFMIEYHKFSPLPNIELAILGNQSDVLKWWVEDRQYPITKLSSRCMAWILYGRVNAETASYLLEHFPWIRQIMLNPKNIHCTFPSNVCKLLGMTQEELDQTLTSYLEVGRSVSGLQCLRDLGARYQGESAFVREFIQNVHLLVKSFGVRVPERETGAFFTWPFLPRLANWPLCRPTTLDCDTVPRGALVYCVHWLVFDAVVSHLYYELTDICAEYFDCVTFDKQQLTQLLSRE